LREAQAGQSFVSVKDRDSSYPAITETKIVRTLLLASEFGNFHTYVTVWQFRHRPTNKRLP